MKRLPWIITILVCLLALLPAARATQECLPPCVCTCPTATPQPTATPIGGTFIIGHITDAHITGSYVYRLSAIVSSMAANIILDSGDCTETGTRTQWRGYATAMSMTRLPWRVVPGNHDTSFPYVANWIWDIAGYRIIGMNYRAPNWTWLNQAANTTLPVILVYHYANDSAIQAWLDTHNVLLLLSGHLHINSTYMDGETHIVVTARSGLGNYGLVTLRGGQVTVTWKNPY